MLNKNQETFTLTWKFSMPSIRLFVEDDLSFGSVITLSRPQTHYLVNVMRRRTGDTLLLFNGRDGEWKTELKKIRRDACDVKVLDFNRKLVIVPDIWLVFAPIKRGRIDFVAAKSTELGVRVIQPILTDYTAVSRVNEERLRMNAIEAAEQCGALTVPTIRSTIKLSKLLADWPTERKLIICDETGTAPPIYKALENTSSAKEWAILVGPEGGFSESEFDQLRQCVSFIPVSLGPRILRADTAAIAALTCWQSVLGDWHSDPKIKQL